MAAVARILALAVILAAFGCSQGPRIIVEDDDHVIVRGCHECWFKCNGFSYSKSVEFMAELQQRLRGGDRNDIADCIAYPLEINGPIPMRIENRAKFLREFDSVFTPEVIKAALSADPRLVFCRYTGIMLGRGVVWANCMDLGHYLVTGINQTELALRAHR